MLCIKLFLTSFLFCIVLVFFSWLGGFLFEYVMLIWFEMNIEVRRDLAVIISFNIEKEEVKSKHPTNRK